MAPIQIQPQGDENATMGVSVLVIVLAVISAALRFYIRIFTRAGLGADDWLILSAVVATLLTAALLLWGNAVSPAGLWVSENTDPDYVYTSKDIFYLKLAFVTSVLYFTISGATKLGILFMYHRIFSVSRVFRYQLFVAGGLVVGWWVGCTVATLTNCIPLEWSWINSLADPRYCFNYNIFWMASGACEILLDVLILTLPIGVVVRMHLSPKQKLSISGIFLLGGFVIITGLVRVILGYPSGSRVPSYSKAELWTAVHAGMAIVCASLPTFRPLVSRFSGAAFMARISSLLSLPRSRESLRSNTDGPVADSKEKGRGSKRSGGDISNDQVGRSVLVTIGGTQMDVSYFGQPIVAYPERASSSSTKQRESESSLGRGEEGHERKPLLELPRIETSEDIQWPFLQR